MKRKLLLLWCRLRRYCVPSGYIYVPDTEHEIEFCGLKDRICSVKNYGLKSKEYIIYYDSDSTLFFDFVLLFLMGIVGFFAGFYNENY